MSSLAGPSSQQSLGGIGQPKKARKNPARRKSSQAKTQGLEQAPSQIKKPTQTQVQAPARSKSAVQTQVMTQSQGNGPKQSPKKAAASSPPAPPLKPSTTTSKQASKTAAPQPSTTKPPSSNSERNSISPTAISTKSNGRLALAAPALVTGGLVGCAAGAAILLSSSLWYDFDGAKSAILTAKAAKLCVDNLADEIISSLKAGTYSTEEALDMLRRTTLAYAGTIPEGTAFVERCFREIDITRKQRGPEVEKVLQEAYGELSRAGSKGATADEMHALVVKHLAKLSEFTGIAIQDTVARNPKLKAYREGAIKSLRGPPPPKVPTLKVNLTIRNKQTVAT